MKEKTRVELFKEWFNDMKHAFGLWLESKFDAIRLWLTMKDVIPIHREQQLSFQDLCKKYPRNDYGDLESPLNKATRRDLLDYISWLEVRLGLTQDEVARAWDRWENSASLANSYMQGRMEICRELDRFGMLLGPDNKIICRGPRTYVNPNTNQVHMVPIMAKGLEPPPIPPFSDAKKPVICWYRVIPDEKIKGKFNEEFAFYKDATVKDPDPKNKSKNKKVFVELPESNVPPPVGGQKFTGKWVWKLRYRTDEISPKLLEDVTPVEST